VLWIRTASSGAACKQKDLAEQTVKIFQACKKVWEAQRDLIDSTAGTKHALGSGTTWSL
jgi:hypothetical protein